MPRVRLTDDEARALSLGHLIPKRGAARAAARAAGKDERGMNKTEAKFARYLDDCKFSGDIRGYWFEAVKFRLADRTWYTPDFLVQFGDGSFYLVETKGTYVREDAWIKLKVAAEVMPFPFYLAMWTGKAWEIDRIKGRTP